MFSYDAVQTVFLILTVVLGLLVVAVWQSPHPSPLHLFLILVGSILLFLPVAGGRLLVWSWVTAASMIRTHGHLDARDHRHLSTRKGAS